MTMTMMSRAAFQSDWSLGPTNNNLQRLQQNTIFISFAEYRKKCSLQNSSYYISVKKSQQHHSIQ